jgi:Aldehyde dehydrogenase family
MKLTEHPSESAPDSARMAAIDAAVASVREAAGRLASLSLEARIELVDRCAAGVIATARDWVEAACENKRIPEGSGARSEEITAGPITVLRQLRLLSQTLAAIRDSGRPHLPGSVDLVQGQVRVGVFPTRSLFDRLVFAPMKAETWLKPGVSYLFGGEEARSVERLAGSSNQKPTVVAVLGAGNVSSIPATDALTKILQENKAVVLKMNPVNEYLADIFERALAPLIEAGFLRIARGGADIGSYLVGHDGVDEVHITGSAATHDSIVWGADAAEREERKVERRPALDKPITSELGNVTPWMIVPGRYTDAELRFQAESVAASIVNNASFNCIATKVIVTCKQWPQRERFLDYVKRILADVPRRYAYYPGAADRYCKFAGRDADDPQYLPWTLLRDVGLEDAPHLFEEESFVGVCAETALDAQSAEQFLYHAIYFLNERLWGTLAAAITVPSSFRKRHATELDAALRGLRYGTIGINQWPGVAYALMSTPWGAHAGGSGDLTDVQSGIGWVHNTYLLDSPEKTIFACPLKFSPKPIWFPTHGSPEQLAWRLLDLYAQPSIWQLPGLFATALRG